MAHFISLSPSLSFINKNVQTHRKVERIILPRPCAHCWDYPCFITRPPLFSSLHPAIQLTFWMYFKSKLSASGHFILKPFSRHIINHVMVLFFFEVKFAVKCTNLKCIILWVLTDAVTCNQTTVKIWNMNLFLSNSESRCIFLRALGEIPMGLRSKNPCHLLPLLLLAAWKFWDMFVAWLQHVHRTWVMRFCVILLSLLPDFLVCYF